MRIDRDLLLPDSLREELQKPFGKVMECADIAAFLKGKKARVATIGDSVSLSIIEGGVLPSLIIWDGKTHREPMGKKTLQRLEGYAQKTIVKNPAGTITKAAWEAVINSLSKKKASIFVEGEEDLLAIPAILGSKDGGYVVYGMPPGKGAILIVVDRKIKAVFQDILSRFK